MFRTSDILSDTGNDDMKGMTRDLALIHILLFKTVGNSDVFWVAICEISYELHRFKTVEKAY